MEHKSNMCLILCGEIYMLNLDDALLFEADDHYTEIHNLYGNKIMVPFCLGERTGDSDEVSRPQQFGQDGPEIHHQ